MRYVYNPLLGLNLDIASGLGEQGYTEVVANYNALPDPTTVLNKFYFVENSQGTQWLPGNLGGTYYPAGTYYSNGIVWEYQTSVYQATQATVNAGIVTDQFVSPATLNGWTGLTLQRAYNNGSTISVTDAFGSVIFRNTRALDTSIIFEVKNIVGTTTFNIKGSGDVDIASTTASTSASTGALVVAGGVGISIKLNVGGSISNNGALNVADASGISALFQATSAVATNEIWLYTAASASTSNINYVRFKNNLSSGSGNSASIYSSFTDTTLATATSEFKIDTYSNGLSGNRFKISGVQTQIISSASTYSFNGSGFNCNSAFSISASGTGAIAISPLGGSTASNGVRIQRSTDMTNTSGTANFMSISNTNFAPTSGTGIVNAITIDYNINQTGTASGTVRGIYYNPTITSVLGPHYGWESTSGDIKFGGTTQKTYFNDLYILDFDSTTYKKALTGNTITNQLNVGEDFTNGIRVFNKFGLGVTPASVQTGGAATATSVYTATEQSMLQKVYDMARTFGFLT